MTSPMAVIDAGPCLNFCSANKHGLIFAVLGTELAVAASVEAEGLAKARTDKRFERAAPVLLTLKKNYLKVLPDGADRTMLDVMGRVQQHFPVDVAGGQRKDLGEFMTICHGVERAERGLDSVLVVDDGRGVAAARIEQKRLERLHSLGRPVGNLYIVGTIGILQAAVRNRVIGTKAELRRVYGQLRGLDDGLVAIEQSGLLRAELWRSPSGRSDG